MNYSNLERRPEGLAGRIQSNRESGKLAIPAEVAGVRRYVAAPYYAWFMDSVALRKCGATKALTTIVNSVLQFTNQDEFHRIFPQDKERRGVYLPSEGLVVIIGGIDGERSKRVLPHEIIEMDSFESDGSVQDIVDLADILRT